MIVERAPAKINLALHVRARRPDGYHELETLFAFCREGDEIFVEPADRTSFEITGPEGEGLTTQGDNLVLRAEWEFVSAFKIQCGHKIVLDKHLPVSSGIGGGSADAAATLRAMARLHGKDPLDPILFDCAEKLGADVPACLLGKTAIGRGKGEKLTEIGGTAGMPVLLVNPRVEVSTAAVFAAWEGWDRGPLPEGDALTIALHGRNDLELPARALAAEIDTVLAWLAADAPIVSRMSGSGATCFALYDTPEQRDAAAAELRPDWWHLATELS